jgi:transketolase
MEKRDRFVLSKGHCAPLLYAVLAELDFFPRSELDNFRKYGSILQGHPDSRKTPGVEISTGSLGQGLSLAGGMALGVRLKGLNSRVYCLMGDGEIEEGQIWEAAMAIPHYKLDNLCAMVDSNRLQIDGPVADVLGVEPIAEKFKAFGWHTCEIDGHDYNQIDNAFCEAEQIKGKPTVIVLHTIKGKGVSYMENQVAYHHAKDLPEELLEQAIKEIDLQYGVAK